MPWSDWQDPWLAPLDVNQSGKYFRALVDVETDPSATAIAPLAATAKATINAGGGTLESGWGSSEILAFTNADRDTGTSVQVELGYSAALFDAAAGEDGLPSGNPPLLDTLTFGVDYDVIPEAEQTANTTDAARVDYESSGQTFAQWDVLHGSMNIHLTGTVSGTSLPNPIPIPLRFWGYTALSPHAGNATAGPALDYAPSNVIGDVDFSADFAGTPSGNFGQDVGDLDLSAQAEAFTLVTQCRWQGDVDVLTDEIVSGSGFYELFVFARPGAVPPARALYTTPRWRYWIPDTGTKWHTVGGHFSTVGPAGLRINTPGAGWVDVVDGPG